LIDSLKRELQIGGNVTLHNSLVVYKSAIAIVEAGREA